MRGLTRVAVMVVAGVVLVPSAAFAASWHTESLDGDGGPNGRIDSLLGSDSSAVLAGGRPHVFYRDDDGGNLRHGWWNGAAWSFETLDGASIVGGRLDADLGYQTAATAVGGVPHVFYFVDGVHDDLRHGWWNGATWAFETLDGHVGGGGRVSGWVGENASAMLLGGVPHVFYADVGNGDLRHAWWTGQGWAFETLDGIPGPNGRTTNTVGRYSHPVEFGAAPHVFYWEHTGDNLRHAWWSGAAWHFEALDGHVADAAGRQNADIGTDGKAAVVLGGRLHVFYARATGFDLRHAWWTGQGWAFETLDGHQNGPNGRVSANVGSEVSAVLWGGAPHVWYSDATNATLRHAWWTGQGWGFEVAHDPPGVSPIFDTSVVVDGGAPHVFYERNPGVVLNHTWYA